MSEVLAYRIGVPLARWLPKPLTHVIAHQWAGWYYRNDEAGRDAVISNTRQIFNSLGSRPDDAALEDMARKTFENFGRNLVDFFRCPRYRDDAKGGVDRARRRRATAPGEIEGREYGGCRRLARRIQGFLGDKL